MSIHYYKNIEDFYEKNPNGEYFYFSTKAPRAYTEVNYPDNCYLFFGKETKGLDEKLLKDNYDRCIRIPMINDARSLNLSNSVAIGVYEVLRQWDFPELLLKGKLTKFDWKE